MRQWAGLLENMYLLVNAMAWQALPCSILILATAELAIWLKASHLAQTHNIAHDAQHIGWTLAIPYMPSIIPYWILLHYFTIYWVNTCSTLHAITNSILHTASFLRTLWSPTKSNTIPQKHLRPEIRICRAGKKTKFSLCVCVNYMCFH